MSTTKHTTIEQLKKLALRTKSEIGLVDAKVAGLTTKHRGSHRCRCVPRH